MQTAVNHIAAAFAAYLKQPHYKPQAIICPGSRNAPITMAFARHPDIECHSIVDERSAGFVALGMAQRVRRPVALICTSGSAVVNFYPAVVEAFYQCIPLLIITADRPPELIDQWDGQTMHQSDVFGKHVKASYTLPDDYIVPEIFSQTTAQAFKDSNYGIKGPVHINVPLREPLYDAKNEKFEYPTIERKFEDDVEPQELSTTEIEEAVAKAKKVLIFNGANFGTPVMAKALSVFNKKAVVLSDVVSSLHEAANVKHWDFLLSKKELWQGLVPDVLITTGTSTVSKNLKLFLRKYKPKYHFHISENGDMADPFQTQPSLIKGQVHHVLGKINWDTISDSYLNLWKQWDAKISELSTSYFADVEFGEFSAVRKVLVALPERSYLQLANSMAVRWANLLGVSKEVLRVNSNRGVSGIDGCTSTAVGMAYLDKVAMNNWKKTDGEHFVTLITGDVAFFYDSNALWNKFAPANLRIVILNNGGGGIFRLIDGPQQMQELGEFLETQHQRSAALLAKDMGVEYVAANNYDELRRELGNFYNPSNKPKILEVFTDRETNTQIFNEYKKLLHGLE